MATSGVRSRLGSKAGMLAKAGLAALTMGAGSLLGTLPAGASGSATPKSLVTLYSVASADGLVAVAADQYGDVFVSGGSYSADNGTVSQIGPDGTAYPVIGGGSTAVTTTPIPVAKAHIGFPDGVAFDPVSDNLYIADASSGKVYEVSGSKGTIWTVAGGGSTAPGKSFAKATNEKLGYPLGIAVNGAGDVFIAETTNPSPFATPGPKEVDELTPGGYMKVIAGDGTNPPSDTAQSATSVALNGPVGLAAGSGVLYVADSPVVEKVVLSTDELSVVAGGGTSAPSAMPTSATSLKLGKPTGLALDTAGNLYIADEGNGSTSSLLELSNGEASRIAGGGTTTPSTKKLSGSYGPSSVKFSQLDSVAVDPAGELYMTDLGPGSLYAMASAPSLSKLSPASGLPSGEATIIDGSDLTQASKVMFGGKPGQIAFCFPHACVVKAPAGSPGSVTVRVTTPFGTSVVTTATRYTYKKAATKTALKASKATITYGKEGVEHLQVTVSSKAGLVKGRVSLSGAKCTRALKKGKATCTLGARAMKPGRHLLRATYQASTDFTKSTSKVIAVVVKKAPKHAHHSRHRR